VKVFAPNYVDRDHLKTVVERMKRRGPPTIKVIWCEQYKAWVAIEGSHRLRAAKKLRLVPDFVDVSHKKEVRLLRDHYDGYAEAPPATFLDSFLTSMRLGYCVGALHSFKTQPRKARR
jgi:hypothetical protein